MNSNFDGADAIFNVKSALPSVWKSAIETTKAETAGMSHISTASARLVYRLAQISKKGVFPPIRLLDFQQRNVDLLPQDAVVA
jgi:hypothetical protein